MTALLSMFVAKATPYIIAGAILVAFVATYVRGRLSGARLERTKQKAEKADSYEQDLQDLANANIARNSVDSRVPDHDRYRRD